MECERTTAYHPIFIQIHVGSQNGLHDVYFCNVEALLRTFLSATRGQKWLWDSRLRSMQKKSHSTMGAFELFWTSLCEGMKLERSDKLLSVVRA